MLLVGVICLTMLEVTAIVFEVNGQYFAGVVGAICALLGAVTGITVQLKGNKPLE